MTSRPGHSIRLCIRFDGATFELEWAREFTPSSLSTLVDNHPTGVRLTGAKARDNGVGSVLNYALHAS